MERLITFRSGRETLVGTLDLPDAQARVGVLIVLGDNEAENDDVAMLAQDLAAAGLAVLRFDRAGLGQDVGRTENRRAIAAADALLRREAGVEITVGVGEGDAAAALALNWGKVGVDSAIFANPWPSDQRDSPMSPSRWERLLTGRLFLPKSAGSARPTDRHKVMVDAMSDWSTDATIVLATLDPAAIAFAALARALPFRMYEIESDSFAGEDSRRMLVKIIRQEAERIFDEIERVSNEGG